MNEADVLAEATPMYDCLLDVERWQDVATFPWDTVRGEDPQPWNLYSPGLRDLVVKLAGRDDFTAYTGEHARKLSAMLNEKPLGQHDSPQEDPAGDTIPAGSDGD